MRINHNSSVSIVLSSHATRREHFAAEELRSYLQKLTGVTASIVTAGHDFAKLRFILGGPERNEAAAQLISKEAFCALFTGEEGFVIRSFGEDSLLIAGCEGSNERGTIYGVYEFLERYCGCSLCAYSHPDLNAGEWVPHVETLEITEVDYVMPQSSRPFRGACVQYGMHFGDPEYGLNDVFFRWLIKNRYNSLYFWTSTYEKFKASGLIDRLSSYGFQFMVGHHDVLDVFLPPFGNEHFPERYYETHPEFFRLEADGTRFLPDGSWGQLIHCSRNEVLLDEISNNFMTWLKDNPLVKMIQLSPHDGVAPQCVCPECSKYTKTQNFAYYANEIAKRISKVFPEVMVVMTVYTDLWVCPEELEVCPNFMIIEATWSSELRHFGKPDGTGLIGTDFDTNVLDWMKRGVRAIFYDYYMGVYPARQRYIPMADELQAIWKHYIAEGIDGSSTQIECYNLWNNIFNFYSFGRTAYDVSLSMQDNLARFTRIFGEGGKYVAEAIELSEKCADGQVPIMQGGLHFLEHIDWEKLYGLYDDALSAADSPLARNNLRMMRMSLRYTDLESQQIDAKHILDADEFLEVRPYEDISQELLYLTRFDSYWCNDPGYGITIPCNKGETVSDVPFAPEADKWYCFE